MIHEIGRHIQFWDRFEPSLKDAMQTCVLAFRMLAEAVPVAMEHIGSKTAREQYDFWTAFHDLDRETDFFAWEDARKSLSEIESVASEGLDRLNEGKL